MNLPDRIFTVGGAGKAIAMELLETEWLLEGVLEPRPNPQSLTITILDTAQGEENTDRRKMQEIRERINEKKADLRDTSQGRVGDIDIEYKLITKNIQLNSSIDLIGDGTVPRIAAGNGMDEENWWLDKQHINENLDFAKGVVRKRGLGKAIFYKAYAEDDTISSYIDLPDKGQVAILTGLGGGTGSGISIDLAKHFKEKEPTAEITLFGVLPNTTEGLKENTNAFAALSELEYLALNEEPDVFKDRILLPIDPTGFDGKTGNRIQTEQFLDELDSAAIYMLLSYYNTEGLEDPFVDTPDFAPFTVAVPQVIRYNVEAISQARESIRDILEKKQEAIEVEERLYADIDRFLAKHYTSGEKASAGLRDLDRTDLTERIENVDELIDFDLFNELGYESVSVFDEILREARQEGDSIEEQIDIVDGTIRTLSVSGDGTNFVDNIDEMLAEILEGDLRMITHRKQLLKQKQTIDESQVREAIEYLLLCGEENINPGVKLNRIEAKREELETRADQLEDDLDEVQSELEDTRKQLQDSVDRQTDEFIRSIEQTFDEYELISQINTESHLSELESALEEYQYAVANSDDKDGLDAVQLEPVQTALDAVENDLERVGVPFDKRRDIEQACTALKRARRAALEMNQEEGTIEKLAPWESSTEEERKEAQKDYRMKKTQLDDLGVYSVGPPSTTFTAELLFDSGQLKDKIRQQEQQLKREIVDEFQTVGGANSMKENELEQQIERGEDLRKIEELVREAMFEQAEGTQDLERQEESIEDELEDVKGDLESYVAVIGLFEEANDIRSKYQDNISAFHSRRSEYDEDTDQSVAIEEDDYVYIKNIKPEDIFRATGNDDIAESDLFKSREEQRRMENNLEELARNARNQRYTGLKHRKFSKDGRRYDGMKIRVAAFSRAIESMDVETLDIQDTFNGAFDLGGSAKKVASPYTTWQSSVGGPWDIGLTVFITGVFLDNLRGNVDADGYRDGYEERKKSLGEDILIHHSLNLEKGSYVRRKDVLNLESPDGVEFFLRDEMEVVEDLVNEYIETCSTARTEAEQVTDD